LRDWRILWRGIRYNRPRRCRQTHRAHR
jgi:hypothetical protein